MKTMFTLILVLTVILAFGCKSETAEKDAAVQDTATAAVAEATADEPEIMNKENGVRYQELVVGTGKEAVDKMQVQCHYTLWFADSTGLEKVTRFQSSKDTNQPFTCQLGVRLIPGWSTGMIGMKEGGTRRIFVPWEQGYGEKGGGPIPPKANLIFEIDFLKAM